MFHTFFIFFICLIAYIQSCGITTHTEIGHRAASHYEYLIDGQISVAQLLKKFQSAFQAGNPYPDAFYASQCKKGSIHDVSEDTHWVPFLNATIRYIQKKYQKPYNEDAQRLIVFTLGYVSHQMADVTWHSLGIDQGFLSAMGFVNFHGSFDQAHSVGDFGGDVVNQFELNTNYISDLGDWYVPYDDLYNIYMEFYGAEKITRTDIIECSSLLFLGRLGEQIAVSLLYADYFKKSSFLADKLNDYFLGGLDDMATWTQLSWNKVFYMLENGVEKCQLDHNILYVNCNSNDTSYLSNLKKIFKSHPTESRKEKYGLDTSYISQTITPKGLILKSNNKFNEYLNRNIIQKSSDSKDSKESTIATYYSLTDNANLGWSLASSDLNNDGSDDLIMGAPVFSELNAYQNGAVYILMSNNQTGTIPMKNLNVDLNYDIFIRPPLEAKNSRFGHSICALDLNTDGFNDIVVSAPSFNLENLKYEGRIYIYFGNHENKYEIPSIKITCKNLKYCNLGWAISKGDVNNDKIDDLIISSPYASTCADQCGFVGVLLGKAGSFQEEIDLKNLDWFINGNMPYEWFGFSIKAKLGYLVVGAPQSRLCQNPDCSVSPQDLQSVGRVYIYKYPLSKPLMSLSGKSEFEQFGYDFDLSFQMGSSILAVSSIGKDVKLDNRTSFNLNRAGQVQLFQIDNSLLKINLISIIKSDRPYASFGSRIKFFSSNESDLEDLFISSQMRSESLALIGQIQEGAVFKFNGGKDLFGNFTDNCPLLDLTPCPAHHAKFVIRSQETRARSGFDFVMLKSTKEKQIKLGTSSIHANNQLSRLSGRINFFVI